MNMELALSLLGLGRSQEELRGMVRALECHRWNNSEEECARLAAAKYVLKRFSAYRDACNKARGLLVAAEYRRRYLQ